MCRSGLVVGGMLCALWSTSLLFVMMCIVCIFFMLFLPPLEYLRVGDDSVLCLKVVGIPDMKIRPLWNY